MKGVVKFKWEGDAEHEAGFAIYETGISTYSLWFPDFRSARLVQTALTDAYQTGYKDGIRSAKFAAHSAISKLAE